MVYQEQKIYTARVLASRFLNMFNLLSVVHDASFVITFTQRRSFSWSIFLEIVPHSYNGSFHPSMHNVVKWPNIL